MRNDKLGIRNCGESLPLARTSLLATPSSGSRFWHGLHRDSRECSEETFLTGFAPFGGAPYPQRPHLFFGGILFILLTLFSCVSMQDDVYYDSLAGNEQVLAFEKRFAEIDAVFFDSGIDGNKALEKKAEKLISDIDDVLQNPSLKKAAQARLYALAGCTAFDLEKKGRAKKYYENSLAAFKGDARSLILAGRLGLEKKFSEKMKAFSDKSLLVLEQALVHYSAQDYNEAVAKFDEAFLSLDDFYRVAYKNLRATSWSLRNMKKDSDSRSSELLSLKTLTVMQMLLIANHNPGLLFNYTAGKDVSDKELYKKIAGSGLLNPASKPLDSENAVSRNSSVTRLIAARFLWNLYNQRKNRPGELTKYSQAYKNKKRSPVLDVKVDSPDFDAVLGCVESEIMHLEDGIEFGAEKEVSGVEFDESVKKIR